MTNLENGTASDGPVATVKAESLGNCHKCNLPIEGYDSACSVSNWYDKYSVNAILVA